MRSDLDLVSRPSGTALCLSGGGYRAMLFHAGVLWRLHDAGVLAHVDQVSAVSGGAITAAALALGWSHLQDADAFEDAVVAPLRRLAERTIDVPAGVFGPLLPGGPGARLARAYDRYLCGGATLADLPEAPAFVFNATSLETGGLWQFGRGYMAGEIVGRVDTYEVSLASAVAASSAFPPFLAPYRMRLDPHQLRREPWRQLQRPPYSERVTLVDGGVYDNLGLEPAWAEHGTVLISDAGAAFDTVPRPPRDWGRMVLRVLFAIDNQVRSLRRRYVAVAVERGVRRGASWSIRPGDAAPGVAGALPSPPHRTRRLADLPTRLRRLSAPTQQRLVNWGYASCDLGLRADFLPELPAPASFPYPTAGI